MRIIWEIGSCVKELTYRGKVEWRIWHEEDAFYL